MKKLRRKCVTCETIKTAGEDIFWQEHPFASDVNDCPDKMWLCEGYAYEAQQDI